MAGNYSIFISSSDSYSDLWPVFFDLFKKYWPDYEGKIYLNTERKTFKHKALNIVCTNIGEQSSFGTAFRKGLEKIDDSNVLLIMIDYLFMGHVNIQLVEKYYRYFTINNLESFCLINQNYNKIEKDNDSFIAKVVPPSKDMFSFQIAFWNKTKLYDIVLPHENPWASEWYGTKRANANKLKLACPANQNYNAIIYNTAGCLHKGKWLQDAIDHLEKINYKFDFNARGHYIEMPRTMKNRFKIRWMLINNGLKGSYLDLLKRKY